MTVDQFQIGDYKNFTYLIVCDGAAFVVDPQIDLLPWEEKMKERGAKLRGVLLTHSHWDHVRGIPGILKKYPAQEAPIFVHPDDAVRITDVEEKKRVRLFREGERIPLGKGFVEVLHTPGHSIGECSFLIRGTPDALLTGDTVFVGEVGRTDLPTGDTAQLFASIQRIKKLAPDTLIYPGHDYGKTWTSTVEYESAHSKAFLCKTIEELDALP